MGNKRDQTDQSNQSGQENQSEQSEQAATPEPVVIELGDFEVKSVHPDGAAFPEVRLSHEKSQSTVVVRQPLEGLKVGQIISLVGTVK